ncbi:hypothetical protein QZH41_020690, partial [Actinostola sp. cb2023]
VDDLFYPDVEVLDDFVQTGDGGKIADTPPETHDSDPELDSNAEHSATQPVENLKTHQKIHQLKPVEREFACNHCPAKLSTVHQLRIHQETTHPTPSTSRDTSARKGKENPSPNHSKKKRRVTDSATQPPPPPRPIFQPDPIDMSPVLYPNVDQDIRETIQHHWHQIRTRQSRNNRVQDWYNFRLTPDGHQRFPEYLQQILTDQSTVFKINLSFGYILRNNETDELTYYHTSANNHRLFDEPYLITNPNNLQQLIDDLHNTDFIEWIKQQRPKIQVDCGLGHQCNLLRDQGMGTPNWKSDSTPALRSA